MRLPDKIVGKRRLCLRTLGRKQNTSGPSNRKRYVCVIKILVKREINLKVCDTTYRVEK